jgi:hypothetical protein
MRMEVRSIILFFILLHSTEIWSNIGEGQSPMNLQSVIPCSTAVRRVGKGPQMWVKEAIHNSRRDLYVWFHSEGRDSDILLVRPRDTGFGNQERMEFHYQRSSSFRFCRAFKLWRSELTGYSATDLVLTGESFDGLKMTWLHNIMENSYMLVYSIIYTLLA